MYRSMEIAKIDEPQRVVYGFASVAFAKDGSPLVDHQGDVVDPAEIEKAAHHFIAEYRGSGVMHRGDAVGGVVESVVFTEDKALSMGMPAEVAKALDGKWWIGVKLADTSTFEKVRSGELKMFSIQGRGKRTVIEG